MRRKFKYGDVVMVNTDSGLWLFQYQGISPSGKDILPIPGSVIRCTDRTNSDDPKKWWNNVVNLFEKNTVSPVGYRKYLLKVYNKVATV